jgi:mono/diheme cytochrome c family protein
MERHLQFADELSCSLDQATGTGGIKTVFFTEGLRIARAVCAECHLVDKLPGQSPNLVAPTFEHIANIRGMNGTALTAALQTSHESMPNIIIKGSDLGDVIAYILSLKR